jgi:predicted Na+-dependent transporter
MLDALRIVLSATIGAVAFSVGLSAAGADLRGSLRRPRPLLTAMLAVLVVVPALAVLLVHTLEMPRDLAAALIIIAVAAGPAAAFRKMLRVGGEENYRLTLDVVVLVASVVFVPVAVFTLGPEAGRALGLEAFEVARLTVPLLLCPLLLGAAIGHLAPRLTERAERPLALGVNALVVAVTLGIAAVMLGPLLELGTRGWTIIGLFALLAVLAGHLLGGPGAAEQRLVLAAFCGLRFPGLMMLLAQRSANGPRLLPAVIAYLLSSGAAMAVYVAISRASGGTRPALFGGGARSH